jgi:hypothetical protein
MATLTGAAARGSPLVDVSEASKRLILIARSEVNLAQLRERSRADNCLRRPAQMRLTGKRFLQYSEVVRTPLAFSTTPLVKWG